jgi:ribonuclease E
MQAKGFGGLLVIDFIDMRQYRNKRQVESTLKDAVKQDRARISIGHISKFGLLEMSRQRLRPSLGESAYKNCPKCSGMGKVRSTESLALSVLRLIEEEARKENTASVIADIPPDSATYLLNEKKQWIKDIEKREGINIILIADSETLGGNFTIKRLKADEVNLPEYKKASYKLGKTLREDIDSTINHINQNKFRNSNPHPLTAWEVDDIKAPNLMDRFMFWLLNNKKNTIKPKQERNKPKAKTGQRNIHQEKRRRPNNKKPSPKKPSPKKPSPKKPSPKETVTKENFFDKRNKKKPVKKKAVKKILKVNQWRKLRKNRTIAK